MIKIDNWEKFKVKDLFKTTARGNVFTGRSVPKKFLVEGNTPRITAKGQNNGVDGYYRDIDNKKYVTHENFISVSFLGDSFYHPYKASIDMKVHVLKLKENLNSDVIMNEEIGLFLVSSLRKSIEQYNYTIQLNSTDLAEFDIVLPKRENENKDLKNEDGEVIKYVPDWKYMEEFIKIRKEKASSHIESLLTFIS